MEHVVVYAEPGRFAGWPANNGVWIWDGLEILVGFTVGDFQEQASHNIREPYLSLLARSRDGGQSWTVEQPENYIGRYQPVGFLTEPLDLSNPQLAIRVVGTGYHGNTAAQGQFFASLDRGQNWAGPFSFRGLAAEPKLQGKELTPRTDNLLLINDAAFMFLSARAPGNWADEKVFCVRTGDGGRTFQFVAWIVDPADPYRAVMPNTVQLSSGELIAAVRRREMGTNRCWLDVYSSGDGGHRWTFRSQIAETGPANGNPPALVGLADGRLGCAYGNRAQRQIEARYSRDQGLSWSEPVVLRADFQPDAFGDADLGYARLVQRHDGKLVAIYYWATAERPEQHIAATIWTPDD